MNTVSTFQTGNLVNLFEWLHQFKAKRSLALLLIAVNLGGVAYGFYYYGAQFQITPAYLWIFVPDSPLATAWIAIVLVLALLGRQNRWLDALAFVSLVKIGAWTTFVFFFYGPEFRVFDDPLGNLNFHLWYLHVAMIAEAFVLVKGLRDLGWKWLVVLAWFLANDAVDYFYSGFSFGGCIGTRPITVPCRDFDVLIPVTIAITLGSVALVVTMARYARRKGLSSAN